MIYLEASIKIQGMDAEDLALLFDQMPDFNLTLSQVDEKIWQLKRRLAEKESYIHQLRGITYQTQHEEKVHKLLFFQHCQIHAQILNGINQLKSLRFPLIALTEIGWALEEQRYWGREE